MNKFFIILWTNLSLVSPVIIYSNAPVYDYTHPKPSQNFLIFLEDCDYAPTCINYLRAKYPEDHKTIDAILLEHYIDEYQRAISKSCSIEEKLEILRRKETFLIAQPDWIDNGCEPYLASTNDGSDRGGDGLRYKALMIVMDEIRNTSEE